MRSPLFEQTLDREGVNFHYMERLDLKAVDMKKGLKMQARLENPVDEETIDYYCQLYKDGSDGPPLVVWKVKNKFSWVPCDGIQRTHAAIKAGRKTLDAYVIQTDDPQVIDRITWTFNNKVNGRPLTYEERLAHAKTYVLKYGVPIKQVAKDFGVNFHTLGGAVKGEKLRMILQRNNIRIPPNTPDYRLLRLQALENLGEDLFCKAAQIVSSNGASDADIENLMRRIRQAKTHPAKLQVIEEFSQSEEMEIRRATTRGGKAKISIVPWQKLERLLTEANKIFDTYPPGALRPGKNRYESLRTLAGIVNDKLVLIYGLGGRATAAGAS